MGIVNIYLLFRTVQSQNQHEIVCIRNEESEMSVAQSDLVPTFKWQREEKDQTQENILSVYEYALNLPLPLPNKDWLSGGFGHKNVNTFLSKELGNPKYFPNVCKI